MKSGCVAVLGAALAVCMSSSHALAADELTLEAAVGLARERSIDILGARRRVAEAEARLRTRPALRDNPAVDGARGARKLSPADFSVGLSQTFELGGRGGSRGDIDRAGLAREQAQATEVERNVLREVRVTFLRGLHAAERVRLARSVETDAAELERIARRRHETGDIAALDVNVASSTRSRARAELKAAEAAQTSALTELRVLLGLAATEPLTLAGPLWEARSYDSAQLMAGIGDRPEVRALEAQVREAEAEVRLGKGFAWPDVTPAVRYERDEGKRVLWAGLSISLPFFDRGQQLRAVGRARAEGLRAEAEARNRALQTQVQGALALHELRLAAVTELAANAETLADSEALARRSYEVGQIGLGEMLLLRRETAEARRQWLDSLLELAQVRAELDSLAGGSR
jgi:cobalt-zinc-cadmium efflux system outer membrane protein